MERMQAEARQAQAGGVVGLQIHESRHVWGHHAIEVMAIGTAVDRFPERAAFRVPAWFIPWTADRGPCPPLPQLGSRSVALDTERPRFVVWPRTRHCRARRPGSVGATGS